MSVCDEAHRLGLRCHTGHRNTEEGLAIRIARALEGFLYQESTHVVCLCQGFIEKLTARGVPAENSAGPDSGDTERSRRGIRRNVSRANGFGPSQFLILHSGNMGKKQNLINVVNAAEYSQGEIDLVWVLVGEGEDLPALKRAAEDRAPDLSLLPLQPAAAMPQMYAAADVLLLNQVAAMEDAVIPCKLLTYMAAGRPIVAAVNENSEAARVIRRAQCGVIVPAEDPEALSTAMLALTETIQNCAACWARMRVFTPKRISPRRACWKRMTNSS